MKNRELKKVNFGTLIGAESRRAKREARKRKKQNRNALVKAAKDLFSFNLCSELR